MTLVTHLLDDPRLKRLFAALEKIGGETRIVGGAVRDSLLGLKPHEVDLATTALPGEVMTAAKLSGLKSVPTGLDHGTVTVVVEGTPYEITTLREDVETYGRSAKVRFGGDFKEDALRRDFTVNALSLTPDGKLHDYAGGLDDLEARRIRFIGDPATRIAEDHLRILRFFRFQASIGEGDFDAAGLHAAIVARESLAKLSRERVRTELLKLLKARRAVEVMRAMSQAGVIEVILGAGFPARLERLANIEVARGLRADPVLRLMAFAVLTFEDADRLRERLRLTNREHARAARAAELLATLHGETQPRDAFELTRMLFLLSRQATADALALAHAESAAPVNDPDWLESEQFVDETPAPAFPVRGADLVARGVRPGKALGETLKKLQANWIRAGFPRDPAAVLRLVEEAAKGGEN